MGCFPTSRPKIQENVGHKESILQRKTIENEQNIKIIGGLFVNASNEDPYSTYEETKVLGEGSFGKVFKVIHKITKQVRAMKVIPKSNLSEGAEKNLTNEIHILKNLDHPNIIKVYEFYDYNSFLYILTELCTGGELFEITKKGPMPEKKVAHIMKQIFSAVAFFHSFGIVHSDIKPENILIENRDELTKEFFNCKIVDFGSSHKIKSNYKYSIGTPSYLAPESIDLNSNYAKNSTLKCDMWSCGVVMYQLLFGELPFQAVRETDLFNKIKSGKYTIPSYFTISSAVENLFSKLLELNPKKRISADEALKSAFIVESQRKTRKSISINKLNFAVKNIKHFKADKKIQQAALGFIIHHLAKKEDVIHLRDIFTEFDTNGDGRLNRDELITGLSKVMDPKEAKEEVTRVMELIDSDKSGFVEYEEFIRASLNPKKILTDENLIYVYNIFDSDRSGKVSAEEIGRIIGRDTNVSEEVFKQMIQELDINGDGEISFQEFKVMMKGITS